MGNPLPAGPVERAPAGWNGSARGAAEDPGYEVVYIEDNSSNVALMVDLLSDFERVTLISAPSAELGIELVRARLPQVVIMDINLPGMSGFEATRQLKEWPETRHIPVLALSASPALGHQQRAQAAGFYRYLTKPIRIDELAKTLEDLLPLSAAL